MPSSQVTVLAAASTSVTVAIFTATHFRFRKMPRNERATAARTRGCFARGAPLPATLLPPTPATPTPNNPPTSRRPPPPNTSSLHHKKFLGKYTPGAGGKRTGTR